MSNESIGQRLIRCREAMGLTTATAAARLHCDESILVSLEADRFAEIGARVFVQGHLRRYADLLGAPTAELMAEWSAQGASLGAPDLTQIPRAPVRAVDSQAWTRRLGLVAAAVVIAVAAWWILQGAGLSGRSSAPPVSSTSSNAIELTMTRPTSASANAPTPTVVEGSVAPPVLSEAMSTPSVVTTPVPAKGRVSIAVDVRADCWVEIYDVDGQKLYFDNLRRGSEARVSGEGPLRVLLGRADVASLEVDGRAVTIPAELIRNLTAYFTVDAASTLRAFAKPETPAESMRPGSTP